MESPYIHGRIWVGFACILGGPFRIGLGDGFFDPFLVLEGGRLDGWEGYWALTDGVLLANAGYMLAYFSFLSVYLSFLCLCECVGLGGSSSSSSDHRWLFLGEGGSS
jgi:hypothetical protein